MPELMNFPSSAAPAKKVLEITSFAGIDLSSAPADIDKRRSPDAPNMIADALGNPVKRPGFSVLENYGARINGCFAFGKKRVIHAGDALFYNGQKIWDGMADEISSAQIVKDKLYIFDGFEALVFDGNDVHPLSDEAYIPTVLISKNADECERKTVLTADGKTKEFLLEHEPKNVLSVTVDKVSTEYSLKDNKIVFETAPEEGKEIAIKAKYINEPGGAGKEEFNFLSRRWKESFYCDTGTEKDFTLSQKELAEGTVRAWVMDEHGEMIEKFEDEDFSVNRDEGKIAFNEVILKAPVTGQDNLVIEAEKYFEGYENKINLCKRSIAFDSGGTTDRLFVCGNPLEPNKDFWCAAGDPSYWPDTYYSELAVGTSEIVGYSIIENYLAAHIAPAFDGRSIVLRSSSMDENGNVSFPIVKHLQGEEAAAPNRFIYMEREPLFLTKRGVYAITAEDVSGEKYTQNRSFYINKELCQKDIKNAYCAKWKQFYVISVSGDTYILDTNQRSYQRGEPLSSYQYECYLWNGFEARTLCEHDGVLYFGDSKGNICRFVEGKFNDDGRAINAYWTVPDFYGESFWKNKTIRTVAIQAAALPQNEIRLEVKNNGFWSVLKEWKGKISYFSWGAFSWDDLTWSGNTTARTLTVKTKIKKFDKTAFKIVCDHVDRGFGFSGFAIEYTESGRYKK